MAILKHTVDDDSLPDSNNRAKRARHDQSSVATVEDDDAEVDRQFQERFSDVNQVEVDDDEAYMQYRTQLESQYHKQVAENGIVLRVELVNFMCHAHLAVELGPTINFIIGHNGSGKSAILTALTVCLGGKASVTNRANSLKSLVKEGAKTASVTVTLKNEGDGFKTEQYGKEIRVERKFTSDGSSGYRIKSENNVVISTKREELDEILDYFLLVVDNPMAILSQDTARSFLSNSTPEEKYQMSMKAIRLSELQSDYDLLRASIETARTQIKSKKKALKELQEDKNQKGELFEKTQSHRRIFDKLKLLKNQYAWLKVAEKESDVEECKRLILIAEEELGMANEAVEHENERYQKSLIVVHEATEKREQLKQSLNPVKAVLEELRQNAKAMKKKHAQIINDEQQVGSKVRRLNDKIQHTKRKLVDERARLEQIDGGGRAQISQEILQLESEIERLTGLWKASQQEQQETEAEHNQLIEKAAKIKDEKSKAQQECSQIESSIRNLNESERSYYKAYKSGAPMENILKAIKAERGFRKLPVGPIGAHVRLKDSKWSGILESMFSKTLESFAVTCREDQIILRKIFKRFNCYLPIIIRPDASFKYLDSMPDRKYTTVHDILEFDVDYLKYLFIDIQSVEKILLIEDRAEADNVMYSNPRNALFAYALNTRNPSNGFKIGGLRGVSKTLPIYGRRDPPRMRTDVSRQKNALMRELTERQAEVEHLIKRKNEIDGLVQSASRKVQSLRTRERNLKQDIRQHQAKLEEVSASLDEIDNDGSLAALESSLKDLEDELEEQMNVVYRRVVLEKDKWQNEMDKAANAVLEKKAENQNLENELAQFEEEYQNTLAQSVSVKHNADHRIEQQSKRQNEMNNKKIDLQKCEDLLRATINIAAEIGERVTVQTGTSANDVEIQIKRLTEEYAHSQKTLGKTAEQIALEFAQAKQEFDRAMKEYLDVWSLVQALSDTYKERASRYFKFRSQLCQRAKAIFRHALEVRGFQGRLFINHQRETIALQVSPSDNAGIAPGQGQRRKVNTLSGGEKSFTQICFLLALWDQMNCPVRGLDEFDVFMDAVNRRMSLKLMLSAARARTDIQTIFITPQDMGNVDIGDDVKIVRMADPERDQA
ncbi:hypothetical protein V1514DRAFT_328904 [Lipomyces japonicus]|uniref:uncharacterized protein n=1 Tax=Lipomyces japonicus TaxID=56871 RepID=UPI0034CF79C2